MWPVIALGAVGYWLLSEEDARVFVSYDHSEDVAFRSILEAWDKNPSFDFKYERKSPLRAVNSPNEAVVKRALTPMLKRATHLLVIVGEKTHKSRFVHWEIERAQAPDVNLRMAAIKLHRSCKLPDLLRRGTCAWAVGFSRDNVGRVLKDAKSIE